MRLAGGFRAGRGQSIARPFAISPARAPTARFRAFATLARGPAPGDPEEKETADARARRRRHASARRERWGPDAGPGGSIRLEDPGVSTALTRPPWSVLEKKLGYTFRDPALLVRALTHKSYSNENRMPRVQHNETLEFLGDAVLGFVIGELIFKGFPALQEGSLSKIKAHLVSATTLSQKARELGIGVFLRLGSGEARSGGANKDSLLADALEAVIASIYLDGSLPAVVPFISRTFEPDISGIDLGDLSFHDYKTTLQETAQRLGLPLPEYRVLEEIGPDHEKTFLIEVLWNGIAFAQGRGPSKKEAQRQAARATLEKLARQ